SLSTPPALYIFGLSIVMAVVALLLACVSMTTIWREGLKGMNYAVTGIIISLMVLAGPLWYLPRLFTQPRINDVATDTLSPPQFQVLSVVRPSDARPASYPGRKFAELQQRAFPELAPMHVERSGLETFKLVRDAAERLGWEILSEIQPAEGEPGRIEAVARTPIMGFRDDVAIRISPGKVESRVDVRSASRYGQHDFGTNAKRITALFSEVKSELEKGERTALEMELARRAKEERERKRKEEEKMRIAKAKAEAEEREKLRRLREEELKRQEAQLRALSAEEQRTQFLLQQGLQPGLLPVPGAAPNEPKRKVRRRDGRWSLPADKFFQRFGE
ncbi:MAG: DUF1499 domain-containing protein, partial [Alphaproteobacteria bacterium]